MSALVAVFLDGTAAICDYGCGNFPYLMCVECGLLVCPSHASFHFGHVYEYMKDRPVVAREAEVEPLELKHRCMFCQRGYLTAEVRDHHEETCDPQTRRSQ